MNLYQIDQAILGCVDMETGEIIDIEALEALQMERDAKIEGCACYIKNLAAEAAAIRQEELNLAGRRHSLEKKTESLKKYLKDALCGQKFQTSKCAITFRNTNRVDIEDQLAVVEWAQKNGRDDLLTFEMPKVSKTEVCKILKEGVLVPGAVMVADQSMTVK